MLKTITKAAVLAAVAGSLNLAVATPADAQVPPSPANGRRCGFASVTDPQVEGEVQTGQMNGGPIVAAAAGADISITCAIHVGGANATHAGFDEATASSALTTQVAVLPPTAISYPSPEGQPVYQCTEITVGGDTWYWSAAETTASPVTEVPQLAEAVGWTTDVNSPCNEAISQEIFPGPLAPVLDELAPVFDELDTVFDELDTVIDELDTVIVDHVDPVLCALLVSLAGSDTGLEGVFEIRADGDVYVAGSWVWDCKPYGTSGP